MVLWAPASWLTDATGVRDKLVEGERHREAKARAADEAARKAALTGGDGTGAGVGASDVDEDIRHAMSGHLRARSLGVDVAAPGDAAATGGAGTVPLHTGDVPRVAVGMASVRGRHPMGARIAEVFVREEYRRKGFARLLLNMLVELVCHRERVPSLCLFADADDASTAALMAKAGFTARDRIVMVDIIAEGGGRVCAPGRRGSCLVQ